MIDADRPFRARWDTTDLKRRLCFALDIAKQTIECLAKDGYKDSEVPANNVRPEKVICETAILLYAASAASHHAEVSAAIGTVAKLLIPHARSTRMLLGVCLEPSLALDYAEAHICLSRLGYQDLQFDELLRQSRNAQAGFGRERVPHRVLEQRWIDGIWMESISGGSESKPSQALLSVLNQPIDVLGGSREDIYAFTHALMYVRDFNIRPPPLAARTFRDPGGSRSRTRSLPRRRRLRSGRGSADGVAVDGSVLEWGRGLWFPRSCPRRGKERPSSCAGHAAAAPR